MEGILEGEALACTETEASAFLKHETKVALVVPAAAVATKVVQGSN